MKNWHEICLCCRKLVLECPAKLSSRYSLDRNEQLGLARVPATLDVAEESSSDGVSGAGSAGVMRRNATSWSNLLEVAACIISHFYPQSSSPIRWS